MLQSFLVNGAVTLVFKKHNGPTPADDYTQIITDCGNLTLDLKQLGLWAFPLFLQTLGPWFPNEIQNLLSSERGLWSTGQQSSSSSLSPGKTPLTTTVAKFLDTSVCGALDALTPASVHSLWSSPKFLNWFRLTILISLRFSRLVVHLFPSTQLSVNMLGYSTLWTASLVMNVCVLRSLWRVSIIVFWTTVRSAVSPWLCSLVNQTERPFWRPRKPLQVFWVD